MLQDVSIARRFASAKAKTPFQFNIGTMVWSILLIILSGIVGNRSDAAFLQLWVIVTTSAVEDRWMIGAFNID